MKIEIRRLVLALFWPSGTNYLDLETGRIYDSFHTTEKMRGTPNKYMRIPKLSSAFIRQLYMEKAFSDGVMKDTECLHAYPHFTAREKNFEDPRRETIDILESEYIEKSAKLCEAYDLEDEAFDLPGKVRTYEPFSVFCYNYSNEYAKKWCEEHGFDYYIEENNEDDEKTS